MLPQVGEDHGQVLTGLETPDADVDAAEMPLAGVGENPLVDMDCFGQRPRVVQQDCLSETQFYVPGKECSPFAQVSQAAARSRAWARLYTSRAYALRKWDSPSPAWAMLWFRNSMALR